MSLVHRSKSELAVIEHAAQAMWFKAGAVIPWEKADPKVQAKYRARAEDFVDRAFIHHAATGEHLELP